MTAGEPPADEVVASDLLNELAAAQDMMRAVAAGEVDAFVFSDGEAGPGVFTVSTVDQPYRMFVENVRDGAATLSADGHILYVNRRLAELLGRSREALLGRALTEYVTPASQAELGQVSATTEPGGAVELELLDGEGASVPVRVASWPMDVEGEALTCVTSPTSAASGRVTARSRG